MRLRGRSDAELDREPYLCLALAEVWDGKRQMIENDIEKALKVLIDSAITDDELISSVGDSDVSLIKGKRILIFSSDAISVNPSITNVFELTCSVQLLMNPRENTETQMEERSNEISSVLTSTSIIEDMNAEMSEGQIISARLYDLRREVIDNLWIRTANIRFISATS